MTVAVMERERAKAPHDPQVTIADTLMKGRCSCGGFWPFHRGGCPRGEYLIEQNQGAAK